MGRLLDRIDNLPTWARVLVYIGFMIVAVMVGIYFMFPDFYPSLIGKVFPSSPSANSTPHAQATALSIPTVGSTITQSNLQIPSTSSPYIFGTNFQVTDSNDQALSSPETQDLLTQMHIRTIRITITPTTSDDVVNKSLQTIKKMKVVPVFALKDLSNAQFKDHMVHVVDLINQQMGTADVYFELGDEEDLQHMPVENYISTWNVAMPLIRTVMPLAKFVGPATSEYNGTYLSAFLKGANPWPDAVSWHEYTCVTSDDPKVCIDRIVAWHTHINDARQVMTDAIGVTRRIMITEWNYAANAVAGDGKISNLVFMREWTTRALYVLGNDGVYASMQSAATGVTPLVNADYAMTMQGSVLQSQYERAGLPLPASTQPPIQSTATATATVKPKSSLWRKHHA